MLFLGALFVACSANNLTEELTAAIKYDFRKMKKLALLQKHEEAEEEAKQLVRRSQTAIVQEQNQSPEEAAAAAAPATATAHPADAVMPKIEELPVDKEGYEKDWHTEHRSEPYPDRAVDKFHHPEMSEKYSASSAAATSVGAVLLLALLF